MKRLKAYVKKLKTDPSVHLKAMFKILKKHEQAILDLNRQQMMEGFMPNGERTPPYKDEEYAIMKELYNPAGVMDFRLTGSLHENMYIGMEENYFFIDSTDPKRDEIVKKFGNPFGLTKENQRKVRNEIIKEDVDAYYKKFLSV